uniref:Uncharacterized protein n=1 Tax=Arion vulgaris TaxID=1028688 RepID=A0A0B6ZF76_9EUPU
MAGRETDLRPSSRTAINVKMPTNYPESETQQTANHSAPITPSAHITVAFAKADGDAQKQNSVLESIESPIEAQKASELNHQIAALIIERTWISYRNKQMFRLLKHSVCAAEYSLSYEILRKVIPREAQLLNDKSQQVKIRFRFGGEEFPPMIFFKIFIHHAGQKVKYLSGRKMIRPATEAAEDSLRQMGNRTFYDQILKDILWQQNCSITDEIDVTTLKDYMQYLANLDESPAWQGGKENCWRKLTLDGHMYIQVLSHHQNPKCQESQVTVRLQAEDQSQLGLRH